MRKIIRPCSSASGRLESHSVITQSLLDSSVGRGEGGRIGAGEGPRSRETITYGSTVGYGVVGSLLEFQRPADDVCGQFADKVSAAERKVDINCDFLCLY